MQLPSMRLVDLSVPLEHLAPSEPLPAKIHYVRHDGEGLAQMQQFFGVTPADLVYSNGQGWAVEEVRGDHAHRHPRRRSVPLRRDLRGQTGPHDRPGAAGMVLCARRRARHAAQSGRRIHHRRRSVAGPRADRPYRSSRSTSCCLQTGADKRLGSPDVFSPARAWAAKACCGWSNKA